MKERKNRFCIKTIKGYQYVYSWSYRPKYLRTKRKQQRFYWRYIGRFDDKVVQRKLRRLPAADRELLTESCMEQKRRYETEQSAIQDILDQEPYKTEMETIL